jgi:hypothetical protein
MSLYYNTAYGLGVYFFMFMKKKILTWRHVEVSATLQLQQILAYTDTGSTIPGSLRPAYQKRYTVLIRSHEGDIMHRSLSTGATL